MFDHLFLDKCQRSFNPAERTSLSTHTGDDRPRAGIKQKENTKGGVVGVISFLNKKRKEIKIHKTFIHLMLKSSRHGLIQRGAGGGYYYQTYHEKTRSPAFWGS